MSPSLRSYVSIFSPSLVPFPRPSPLYLAVKVINGIKITESGLLAAAHLGGASSVKTYLRSNGKNGFRDGFGTSLKSYIKKFNGYDTSNINPDRFAKVIL